MKVLALITLLQLWPGLAEGQSGNIELVDGGYSGVLVLVDDAVDYEAGIMASIQESLVNASRALYEATAYNEPRKAGSARYFSDVTVVIPDDWPVEDELDFCTPGSLVDQKAAHFRVENDNTRWGRLLHTEMSNSDCGVEQLGQIYIPKSFFTDQHGAKKLFGQNLGMPLLHEWSHKRYGLRDESTAKEGGANCQAEMYEGIELYRPVRCAKTVWGHVGFDKVNNRCVFLHTDEDSDTAKASVMFYGPRYLPTVKTFCDASTDREVQHDFRVDHEHNRLCNGRTGWEVLRDHADFKAHAGAPYDADLDPGRLLRFSCVRQRPRHVVREVLVMDVSGSMSGGRLQRMREAVARHLDDLFYSEERVEVGLVEFHSSSEVLAEMTPLQTEQDLQALMDSIPRYTKGVTCIGCGIRDAMELLRSDNQTAHDGKIFVFTDGMENVNPSIRDVTDEVLGEEVAVFGLLMDAIAASHPLVDLALKSNGGYCIYTAQDGGLDFYNCLSRLHGVVSDSLPLELKSEDGIVSSRGVKNDSVQIDSSFKSHVRFSVSWPDSYALQSSAISEREKRSLRTGSCDDISLSVVSPNGTVIDENHPGYEKRLEFKMITIQAFDNMPGEWSYSIQNPSARSCAVKARVDGFKAEAAEPGDDGSQPIALGTSLSATRITFRTDAKPTDNAVLLRAMLTKGQSAVLGASLSAQIERRNQKWTVQLLDNGAGADLKKDDGVYSQYFYQYSGDGAYNTRFFASGSSEKAKIQREERRLVKDIQNGKEAFTVQNVVTEEPCEAFERSAQGEAFEVINAPRDADAAFPPARIIDLKVTAQDANTTVTLAWTAVGGSLDRGQASYYEMRVSNDAVQLRDNFSLCTRVNESDVIDGTLSAPKSAGQPELLRLSPLMFADGAYLNGTYYLAVAAVDAHDHHAQTSNMAPAHFASAVPPPLPGQPASGPGTALLVGAVCAAAAVLAVLLVGTVVALKHKQAKVHPGADAEGSPGVQMKATASRHR